jgi:hypothetical protein
MQSTHTKDRLFVTNVHGYSVNGRIIVVQVLVPETTEDHHPAMVEHQSFNHHQLLLNQAAALVNKAVSDQLDQLAQMVKMELTVLQVRLDHQDVMARLFQQLAHNQSLVLFAHQDLLDQWVQWVQLDRKDLRAHLV